MGWVGGDYGIGKNRLTSPLRINMPWKTMLCNGCSVLISDGGEFDPLLKASNVL